MRFRLVLSAVSLLAAISFVVVASAQVSLPGVEELEAGIWNTIEPGGETLCARGTEYAFFVRPGDPERLMIYFQGGGACWNALTCDPNQTFFDQRVGTVEEEIGRYGGVFDFDNPENPVSDYSIVFVPYCTADVHSGRSTRTYNNVSGDYTVAFNGFVNSQAALDWVYANYDAPQSLIVTGSSAGAYGAVFHAHYILERYPEADAVILGDAGAGITAPTFDGLEQWSTLANAYEGSAENTLTFNNELYASLALNWPQARVAQYTANQDSVQVFFYLAGGGDPTQWGTLMRERLAALGDAAENFFSFIAGGSSHTILASDLFYTLMADGTRFLDWFNALLERPEDARSVVCTDCLTEEVYTP